MTDTTAIRKQKDAEYGDPAISLKGIGLMWTGILMVHWRRTDLDDIPPHIVALMMAAMKDARIAFPRISEKPLDDARTDNYVYHKIEQETRG